METFTETQRFRQGWVWAIMGLSVLIFVTSLSTIDAWTTPAGWVSSVPMLAIAGLMYVWRLDTRYDAQGVRYRVWPFMTWRTIRWSEIRRASVSQYDYVGYGIRWNFGEGGWVYNVAGNQGLRILTTAGKRIVMGTQRPDELRTFLDQLPVLA